MDILQKRTWAQIDLDAAAHNFKEIRRYVGNRSMVCCVIKADAYGHGAVRMAEEYEALGADWLALSNIEEALQVRRAGIKLPLLVLGYTPAEAADVLAENDRELTPERSRELHEISGSLLNRVKLQA